ncbi:hypothetical protein PQQ72_08550 [Paraburkholderia strydomiana]
MTGPLLAFIFSYSRRHDHRPGLANGGFSQTLENGSEKNDPAAK